MSKQKFHFRIQPQGLSVKCTSSFLADVNKLPPLYLSVKKGSHSASTSSVQLTASRYKPGCFSASWKGHDAENMVDMTLPLTRRSSGKGYESKEVKVAVKFEEADTGKQQYLASCKFDVTSLHLDKKKSERKVLELIPASDAFKSVSVVMTIAHELADASAAAFDSGSERSGSVSPQNYPTESFVQGIKAGAVGAKSTLNGTTSNGKIHQVQQPSTKQEETTSKEQQLASKQKEPTSKQDHKHEQLADETDQLTNKQEPGKQITKEQLKNDTQEDPNTIQQQTNKQEQLVTDKPGQYNDTAASKHSSVVEPMESNHANHTMDAWRPEQGDKDEVNDKSKVSTDERVDYVTSPISSGSVTSSQYKGSVSDENLDTLQDEDDRLEEMRSQTAFRAPSKDLHQLTPRKRAISVDVLSVAEASKTPVYFAQEHPIPPRRRSQTILGEPKRKAPPIPVDKSPTTKSKKSVSGHSSLGDLRRPVQTSVSGSGLSTSSMAYYGKFDILGILRVKLRGVSIPDHTTELLEAPPPSNLKGLGRSVSVGAMAVPEATHGIYCVFTINGGNTSAKSETCKILPYRPVLWEEDEKEKLFFTNHSRQLFILCRKVPLKKKSKSKASSEVCVGASVMKIIEINPTLPQQKTADYTSIKDTKWYNKSLPLQPKGEIELSVSFEGLTPRYKVTCKGVITVMKVNGIDCQPDVDLSCTVKLDSDMLDSTNVYSVDECAVDGWYDEPIGFRARKNLDLVVQIWAYSDDGTANWCGLTMLPLATILHEHDIQKAWAMTPTGGKEREVFVYNENERTITCPVEPQGTIELKVKVHPNERIKSQECVPIEVSSSHTPVAAVAKITSISPTPPPPTADTGAATTNTTTTASDVTITTATVAPAATTTATATASAVTAAVAPAATNNTVTSTTTATSTSSNAGKLTAAPVAATTTTTTASLSTASENKKQEDVEVQKDSSGMDRDGSPTLKRQGTLRRKFNRDKQRDKSPEPQVRSVDDLRQENIDLKREVEYLREQLRMVKAKLADSEFHKEKAEAELRTTKHKEEKKRTRIFSFGRK